ncbi:MAG: hypothetical protein WA175_05450, partial [Candidatus Acidiferrales bacterium]
MRGSRDLGRFLPRELFEREWIGFKQAQEGLGEESRILPLREAERDFFEVALEMLHGDFMPRAYDAALEKGEAILDAIGVLFAFHKRPVML